MQDEASPITPDDIVARLQAFTNPSVEGQICVACLAPNTSPHASECVLDNAVATLISLRSKLVELLPMAVAAADAMVALDDDDVPRAYDSLCRVFPHPPTGVASFLLRYVAGEFKAG